MFHCVVEFTSDEKAIKVVTVFNIIAHPRPLDSVTVFPSIFGFQQFDNNCLDISVFIYILPGMC